MQRGEVINNAVCVNVGLLRWLGTYLLGWGHQEPPRVSRIGSGSQDPSHHPGQEQGRPGDTRAVPALGIRHLPRDRGGKRLGQDVGTWVRINPVSVGP